MPCLCDVHTHTHRTPYLGIGQIEFPCVCEPAGASACVCRLHCTNWKRNLIGVHKPNYINGFLIVSGPLARRCSHIRPCMRCRRGPKSFSPATFVCTRCTSSTKPFEFLMRPIIYHVTFMADQRRKNRANKRHSLRIAVGRIRMGGGMTTVALRRHLCLFIGADVVGAFQAVKICDNFRQNLHVCEWRNFTRHWYLTCINGNRQLKTIWLNIKFSIGFRITCSL